MSVTFLVGTRPEIVKIAPVISRVRQAGVRCRILHSGQHYHHQMSEVFFRELNLPRPEVFLGIGSRSSAEQRAGILTGLERLTKRMRFDNLVVVGDTNTVLAGALFASGREVTLFHIEAGARCYDRHMPEEQNRVLTDHLSDVLFAPTGWNRSALRKEFVLGKIYVTGNPIIDVCVKMLRKLQFEMPAVDEIPFDEFALVTAHRQETVDNRTNLGELVKILRGMPIPVVFPCHPRTLKRLREAGLLSVLRESRDVLLLPPLGYLDFLALLKRCEFVLSDSGGVSEEATAPGLDKLVFSPRVRTELPEAVRSGHLVLVGPEHSRALKRIRRRLDSGQRPHGHPYGTGNAAGRIAPIIARHGD